MPAAGYGFDGIVYVLFRIAQAFKNSRVDHSRQILLYIYSQTCLQQAAKVLADLKCVNFHKEFSIDQPPVQCLLWSVYHLFVCPVQVSLGHFPLKLIVIANQVCS